MQSWELGVPLKLVIAGDQAVGKTSLLCRFTDEGFSDTIVATIGIDFRSKLIQLPGEDRVIKLQCWDLAGAERFRSITTAYFRSAVGALLVYDVTRRPSFESMRAWLATIRTYGGPHVTCILVANKLDLCVEEGQQNEDTSPEMNRICKHRAVSQAEAERFACEEGLLYVEASAKTGDNVNQVFEDATRLIIQKIRQGVFDEKEPSPPPVNTETGIYSKIVDWFRRESGTPGLLPRPGHSEDSLRASGSHQRPATEAIRISHLMSISDIVLQLGNHGCANITENLDMHACSSIPIARGGFGDVYRGLLKDGTPIAIKTRRFHMNTSEEGQKSLKRAAREIHTWSKCRHPHVLGLLGLVEFHNQIGMVSPWVSNGDIPTYLSQHSNVDRCQMSAEIAEGLAYLHTCNIVHGDLKGSNVLVSSEGAPMLADFGNAVLHGTTLQFTGTTTQPGFSARWTAPELLEGSSVLTIESDVYALGMTILETITGQVPYPNKSDIAVILSIATQKYPERPEDFIPSDSLHGNSIWVLLQRCWAYDPKARPSVIHILNFMKPMSSAGLEPGSATDR